LLANWVRHSDFVRSLNRREGIEFRVVCRRNDRFGNSIDDVPVRSRLRFAEIRLLEMGLFDDLFHSRGRLLGIAQRGDLAVVLKVGLPGKLVGPMPFLSWRPLLLENSMFDAFLVGPERQLEVWLPFVPSRLLETAVSDDFLVGPR